MRLEIDPMQLQHFIAATFAEFYGVAYRTPEGKTANVTGSVDGDGVRITLSITAAPTGRRGLENTVQDEPTDSV